MDLAHDELTARRLTLPEHLQLNYDFTGREGNNQTVATWMAWMQARGKFQTIQDGAGRVGHEHNKRDQRFSSVSTACTTTKLLGAPYDFAEVIHKEIRPTRSRKLVVVKLKGFFDWKELFQPLHVDLHGNSK